jgi:hypothetical protein
MSAPEGDESDPGREEEVKIGVDLQILAERPRDQNHAVKKRQGCRQDQSSHLG